MRYRNGRVGLITAVVVAGAAVVVGSVLAGPVETGPPRWVPAPIASMPTMPAQDSGDGGLPLTDHGGDLVGRIFVAILEIVAVAVAVLIVALIVRLVLRRISDRRRRVRRDHAAQSGGASAVLDADAVVAAPVMQRGIARALALLNEPRAPGDAVVQAWLGLEDAAMAAGARREDAETAAEYAARIVQRFDTDRDAAQRLLRLYHDVRFGSREVDAQAVVEARECLLRLQASWHGEPAPAPMTDTATQGSGGPASQAAE